MNIEVRPIARDKWHEKKGKEDFARPIKIQALVDPKTMQYSVALTEEELAELGKQLNQDLSTRFNNAPHPYWDSPANAVKLENFPVRFNTSNPVDKIKVAILKASRFVANNLTEYADGLWPDATHVIFDEEDEVKAKASKVAVKTQAVLASQKLSAKRKAEIVFLMTGVLTSGKSNDYLDVKINELIEEKPDDFLVLVSKNAEDISLEAFVNECIIKGRLKKVGHKIMYFDSILGDSVESVVEYFKKEENQELKLRLTKELK